MATLIWTEPAVADLEEIGQFISKDNPPAAEKVGSKIIREAENIAAFPRLGRIVPEFATRRYERSSLNRIELFINSMKKATWWRSYEFGMELEAPLSWAITLDP